MTPVTKTFTFALPAELKAGLQTIRERVGVSEAEQIRRAIAKWLESNGVNVKAERKRADTRKRS
jgi:predicted DNA-binding protein